jgi:hypothetical protein
MPQKSIFCSCTLHAAVVLYHTTLGLWLLLWHRQPKLSKIPCEVFFHFAPLQSHQTQYPLVRDLGCHSRRPRAAVGLTRYPEQAQNSCCLVSRETEPHFVRKVCLPIAQTWLGGFRTGMVRIRCFTILGLNIVHHYGNFDKWCLPATQPHNRVIFGRRYGGSENMFR